jgi:hypothetical protein
MIIEVKDKGTFIPRYGGNKKQPTAEQIKVNHRFLLPGERKSYLFTRPIVMDINTGKVDSKVEYVQDEQGIAKAIITSIENLQVKCNGEIVDIKTANDLYNTNGVPQGLVTEIELYMLSVTPEVKEDFLSQPSPSTSKGGGTTN